MAIVEEAEEEEEADEEEGNAVDELVDTDVNELTRLLHSCQANFQRIPFPLDTIRKKKKKKIPELPTADFVPLPPPWWIEMDSDCYPSRWCYYGT